jgi:type III secretion protein HrpB1
MSNLQCSPSVLNAMMSVFSGGMRIGTQSELQDLLAAIRVWQPNSPLADVCEARMLINRTEWREAANLLRHVTSHHASLPIVSALLALCLYMLRDDEWRIAANEAVDSGNDTAVAIVARFMNIGTGDSSLDSSELAAQVHAAIYSAHPVEYS